jgi:hypothetical protein
MPNFKRASLVGSEELFRPTRPQVVADTDEVIKDTVDRPGGKAKEVVLKTLNFTPEEIELLLDAVQVAKYPDRARAKPQLDKFDSLDALRLKIQAAAES